VYEVLESKAAWNKIMTILSGNNFTVPNEFQFIVATSTQLHLCDIRHRNVPLLSWSLNLRLVKNSNSTKPDLR